MNPLDEVAEHGFGDFEVSDHAVFHGTDGHNIAGGAAEHALGFLPDGQNVGGAGLDGDHGGFTQDDALIPNVDEGICGPQVNANVVGKQAFKLREHEGA